MHFTQTAKQVGEGFEGAAFVLKTHPHEHMLYTERRLNEEIGKRGGSSCEVYMNPC